MLDLPSEFLYNSYSFPILMQTSIAIDKSTRDRAAKRAQKEHTPLATVVRILLTDYADGRLSIGSRMEPVVSVHEIPVDKKTQKKMDDIIGAWNARLES